MTKHSPSTPKKIANVQQLKNSGLFSRQLFQVDVDLEATTHIAEIKELALAHIAMCRDPTRHANPSPSTKSLSNFTHRAGDIEPASERIHLLLKQLLQLLTAERKKVVFFHGTLSRSSEETSFRGG